MKTYIYIVEKCLFNCCDWDYSNERYFSTFDKAEEYVKERVGEWGKSGRPPIIQVNENYWTCKEDFETKYGIMKQALDEE